MIFKSIFFPGGEKQDDPDNQQELFRLIISSVFVKNQIRNEGFCFLQSEKLLCDSGD